MSDEKESMIGKFVEPDIGIVRGELLVIFGHFNYEGGGCQGVGGVIDGDFIKRFVRAFGVTCISECAGRFVRVTRSDDRICKIEPIIKSDGVAFDIKEWANRLKDKRKRKE